MVLRYLWPDDNRSRNIGISCCGRHGTTRNTSHSFIRSFIPVFLFHYPIIFLIFLFLLPLGRIFISESTYKKLPQDGYLFEERDLLQRLSQDNKSAKSYYVSRKEKSSDQEQNQLKIIGFTVTNNNETPREPELLDREEALFEAKSKMNRFTLRFEELRLEDIYRRYFFTNYVRRTRIFLIMGLIIHLLFAGMDAIMDSGWNSLQHTWYGDI